MTTPINKKFISLSIIFLIFVLLKIVGSDILTEIESPGAALIIYLIEIGFWIFAAALLNNIVQRLLRSTRKEKDFEKVTRGFIFDLVTILIYVVALAAIIGFVFGEAITSFWILILGVALVVGMVLRTELFRLFPALSFDFNKPLQIGDWIKINANIYTSEIIGKIVDINRKSIFVMCESNTITMVPTKLLNDLIITNYRGPEARTRFDSSFILDFSVPVDRAKRVLLAGALQATEHSGFLKKKHPEVLIKNTGKLGVEYSVYYWINPWKSLTPAQANDIITSSILKHISKAGLSLAYPKEDVFYKEMPLRQADTASAADRKALLANIELFGLLDEDELDYLATSVIQKLFVQGEEIVTERASGDSMFILVEGLCDVYADNDESEQINVGQISPGQFFGEMSLLTGELRSATVIADTDCLVYIVTKDHVEEIIKKRPETAEGISNIIAERRIKTLQSIEESEQHRNNIASQILSKMKDFFEIENK
ncbi:MAG: mechanosensitive ion channel [Bacteroidetes bacterium]|nr:mechanosensitive ion channel [Bacteroidota bacterium]